MRIVILPLVIEDREVLVIPVNMPRVVTSSSWNDCGDVDKYGENVVFGMEDIASVFSKLSRKESVVSTNGVTSPAKIAVGMIFTEG